MGSLSIIALQKINSLIYIEIDVINVTQSKS